MSTIAVNAITDANGGSTTSINGTTPNAYNTVGKNRIINGAMQIAQRGTSATGISNNTYPALDRWKYFLSGPTVDVSQQSFTLGQTDVTGEPEFYLRNTVSSNSGTSDYVILAQHIEDVRTFAGQTCTLSFWAKSSVSGNKIAIELNQSFGTGGSASSRVVTADSDSVTLSTSWQKFSVTLTLPSISGKTIDPSTNTSYLELYLWLSSGSAYDSRASSIGNQAGNFDITLIQFEAGESATEFEHRPYGTELLLCQRYYQFIDGAEYSNEAIWSSYGAAYNYVNWQYKVQMRSQPTIAGLYEGTGLMRGTYGATIYTAGNAWASFGWSNTSGGTLGICSADAEL
jgi:hypothetical protein